MCPKAINDLLITGIPDSVPERIAAVCRSRLLTAVNELFPYIDTPELLVKVGTSAAFKRYAISDDTALARFQGGSRGDDSDVPRPEKYAAKKANYTFDQLVLPEDLLNNLLMAIAKLKVESKVFNDWGLRKIEPFPCSSLNFHGPPGTGKTLAAHALSDQLGRPILEASYADIESKFHGDGPKNVKAIFQAAERDAAVLFIDEADSLLSRRLTNVTHGSEQAINSMRSQLMICIQQFHGVVIFATNLVENYDKAFETRVQHFRFPMPDKDCRRKLWKLHLVEKLPVSTDVNIETLAKIKDICGRDIKNAVIDSAVRAAVSDRTCVTLNDLLDSINRIKKSRVNTGPRPLTGKESSDVKKRIMNALKKKRKKTMRQNLR